MRTYFSKLTGGFYVDEVHGSRRISILDADWRRPQINVIRSSETISLFAGTDAAEVTMPDMTAVQPFVEIDNPDCKIPLDAVEITAEAHAALLAGQATGKAIAADAQGRPVLQDRPPLPFAQAKLAEFTTFRAVRGKMLDCLSGMAGRFSRAGDPTSALACDVLAQGLLDLPAHPSVAAALDAATLRTTMKARYNTLLAAVPTPVLAAYKGVSA